MLTTFVSQTEFSSYEDFYENFTIHIPENFNFAFDVVDVIAAQQPAKTALVWCNEEGQEEIISFAQLAETCNKTANFLVAQGIKKGDKVMLILKRRREFWYCLLALHKIGAVCVPATYALTASDLIYRHNKAQIKAVIAIDDPQVLTRIEQALPQSPSVQLRIVVGDAQPGWQHFAAGIATQQTAFSRPTGLQATNNDDIALLYFTSGTSAMPKMVAHNFVYPLGHIITAKYWQCVESDELHLTLAETGWAKAVWGKLYGQWLCGAAVFVYDFDKFNPHRLLDVLSQYRVRSFCAPPTVYRFLIKENLAAYDLSALRHCSVAGEALHPEIEQQFFQKTGLHLYEGYGQTELTLAIANFPFMAPKAGSMGKPSPGYQIDLIDEAGNLGQELGQIVITTKPGKPLGMFAGYYNNKQLTERVWDGDLYYTGDIARKDADGYFWFVSRADDLIKSSGYRISPYEIESVLLKHPAVLECAVTGVPDALRGECIKATIVLAAGYQESSALTEDIQSHVRQLLAPYKQPRLFEITPELPKTISGKIRHAALRESRSDQP